MNDTNVSKYDTKGVYKWHMIRHGKGKKLDIPENVRKVLWTDGNEVFEDELTYFRGKHELVYSTKFTFEDCIAWMEYPEPPKKIF